MDETRLKGCVLWNSTYRMFQNRETPGTEKREVGCLGPALGEGPSIKGPVFCACVAGEG